MTDNKRMRSFPLRLSSSLRLQATKLAGQDCTSLNHFISLAVAEKIVRLEHLTRVEQQTAAMLEKPPNLFNPYGFPTTRKVDFPE